MIEEYNSIMKNDVWEVVPRPTGKSIMTIAPVARYTTFRTIISLIALFGWKLHQMDVKTAFLKGKIEEEAYIEQPEGFVKKSLYGLNRIRESGMRGWIYFSIACGFPKVQLILTCTLRLCIYFLFI